jgi:hypothetical protein
MLIFFQSGGHSLRQPPHSSPFAVVRHRSNKAPAIGTIWGKLLFTSSPPHAAGTSIKRNDALFSQQTLLDLREFRHKSPKHLRFGLSRFIIEREPTRRLTSLASYSPQYISHELQKRLLLFVLEHLLLTLLLGLIQFGLVSPFSIFVPQLCGTPIKLKRIFVRTLRAG